MIGIWSTGAIIFSSKLAKRGSPGEYMGDFIDDLLHFLRMAAAQYIKLDYFGSVLLSQQFRAESINQLLPKFSILNDAYESASVRLPKVRPQGSLTISVLERIIKHSELEKPSELTAELMLYHLRKIWGAEINFDAFLLEIQRR